MNPLLEIINYPENEKAILDELIGRDLELTELALEYVTCIGSDDPEANNVRLGFALMALMTDEEIHEVINEVLPK